MAPCDYTTTAEVTYVAGGITLELPCYGSTSCLVYAPAGARVYPSWWKMIVWEFPRLVARRVKPYRRAPRRWIRQWVAQLRKQIRDSRSGYNWRLKFL